MPTYTPYPTPTPRPTYTPYPTPTATPTPVITRVLGATFGFGSTEEQVLAAQGTPSGRTESSYSSTWWYGPNELSKVTFDSDGRVDGWSDYENVLNLSVVAITPGATFGFGSTEEQVLAAQGTPSGRTESSYSSTWWYGPNELSKVTFDSDGRVDGWSDYENVLNIQ